MLTVAQGIRGLSSQNSTNLQTSLKSSLGNSTEAVNSDNFTKMTSNSKNISNFGGGRIIAKDNKPETVNRLSGEIEADIQVLDVDNDEVNNNVDEDNISRIGSSVYVSGSINGESHYFDRGHLKFKDKLKMFCTMGCGSSQDKVYPGEEIPVVVFGATGYIGGAVAKALLKDPRFDVRAVTRTPTTDQARALAEDGAVIQTCDLNDSRSLVRVMEGAAGVFITTSFWEHLSKEKEITHGMNAIDAAVSCNIHHVIIQGSQPTDDKECGHMNAKAAIEDYIKETSVPYTSVRVPFMYENLQSLFHPHLVNPGVYTLPIPMGDRSLDCMALQDFGKCITNIFLHPKNFINKTVDLSTDRMTIKEMADHLNKAFDDRKIIYRTITPEDFAEFDFPGASDFSAYFRFLQTAVPRDIRFTKKLCGQTLSFDKWVHRHKAKLDEAMKGKIDADDE